MDTPKSTHDFTRQNGKTAPIFSLIYFRKKQKDGKVSLFSVTTMTKRKATTTKLEDRSNSDKKARNGMPSAFEMKAIFASEEAAFEYLCERDVFPAPPCSSCGLRTSRRPGSFMYRCFACKNEVSAFKGTIFNNMRIGLNVALYIIWAWCMNMTWKQVVQISGLSKDTCTRWWLKLRLLVAHVVREYDYRTAGEGKVVQIDESKFGKRKKCRNRRGHRVEGAWVFGGVEKGAGDLYGNNKFFSVVVQDRTAMTLLPLIIR